MKIWALLVGVVLLGGVAQAQTDVAASVYGAFTPKVTANGVTQSPGNGAGFLAELHHQSNPLVGYVLSYSWNRANETYSENRSVCGLECGSSEFVQDVKANAQEATAAWEVSLKLLNLRPFLLAGGGVLFNQPAQSSSSTTGNHTAGVLVYGGGVDVGLLPHLGIRAQYRGNVYSAPQLSTAFSSTKSFFTTSEPMIGAYLRF